VKVCPRKAGVLSEEKSHQGKSQSPVAWIARRKGTESNTAGAARVTDPQLINPWGISRSPGSAWLVSNQKTGISTVYDGAGAKQSLIVGIPQADPNNKNTPTGTPTGAIFNSSPTDFLLAHGKPARFLFSTIDGTIAGWNPTVAVAPGAAPPSTQAVTMVKTTDGSSYTV
jgi:uncharacterized protein (TIGR03118 family)